MMCLLHVGCTSLSLPGSNSLRGSPNSQFDHPLMDEVIQVSLTALFEIRVANTVAQRTVVISTIDSDLN